MASSRSGAGGKIVTNRRKQRLSTTPYERPPPPLPVKNPNWFTGIVIPSARAVASGAGKFLTSIFYDSYSSSSEEDGDASEDDADNGFYSGLLNEENATPLQKKSGIATKQLIGKLIEQQNFSREECDELIRVLNSRVVGCSVDSGEIKLFDGPPVKVPDHDGVNTCEKAVLEAKKWFQNDRLSLTSPNKFAFGTINSNSTGFQHGEHVGGSPVDVARSYLKNRVSWMSPAGNSESRTPFTATPKVLTEATTQSKRSSLASGSFNIQEELRRVRSKAMDDLLHSSSSMHGSFEAGIVAKGRKTTETEPSKEINQTDGLVDARMSSDPALAALESSKDVRAQDSLQSKGDNKVPEAIRFNTDCAVSEESMLPTDPYSNTINGHSSMIKAAVNPSSINGFQFPNVSVGAGKDPVENNSKHDEEINVANEKHPVANEAYMEILVTAKSDSIASSSQNDESAQKAKKSSKYALRNRGKGK